MDTMDSVWLVSFQKMDQVSRTAYTGHHYVVLHWLAGLFLSLIHI